jgi:peptidoglycan/xylan/chitin deacetylase (PgdA/CDA1 family)
MAPHRTITGLAALLALTTLVHCAEKSKSTSSSDPTCTGAQALQTLGIRGSSMEPKSIALTFDDGPGPRTKQLSKYLKEQGIQAAFFVNGRAMGAGSAEILAQIVADGHLVANHTENHKSLTGRSTGESRIGDGEVIAELEQTDSKIAQYVKGDRFLFRPPFGDYDEGTIAALQATAMNKYVGPILWDVGDKMDEPNGRVADWDCWQDGADGKRTPMAQCGDLYITEIKRASRGIVLLHDPYFNDQDPEQLGTVDMTMYMVPKLKEEGFTFVRVDKIPEVAKLLPPLTAEELDGGTGEPGSTDPSATDNPCP